LYFLFIKIFGNIWSEFLGNKQNLLTEKNVTKALIGFAIPGIITVLLSELYNMVDTFFVGRYVDANAIGALSIAFPLQRLFIALSLLIGVGTSTYIATSLGEKDFIKLKKGLSSAISIGVLTFSLLPILVICFRKNLIIKLGASSEIYPLADEYIKIVLLGSIFLGFINILGYGMAAMGKPKVTFVSTSIGAAVNIILDYITVVILNMGIKGAAISTVISQILGFSYALYKILKLCTEFKLKISFSINASVCKPIVAVGFSSFIVEISDAVIIWLLNKRLMPIGGDTAVIIVGAITRISMLLYITMLGISAGMQPLAAYAYGEGNYPRLKKILKKTVVLASVTSVVLWAGMMIFTKEIIGSFLKDRLILEKAVKAFRTTIIIFPSISIYYVAIYYYQALSQPKISFFLSIYRQLLLFIPVLLIMTKILGVLGAWITYPITDLISAVTGILYLVKSKNILQKQSDKKASFYITSEYSHNH
jgi:putative MATE family efflux protein